MHPVTLQHQCKNCVQQEQGLTEFNRYPQLTMTSTSILRPFIHSVSMYTDFWENHSIDQNQLHRRPFYKGHGSLPGGGIQIIERFSFHFSLIPSGNCRDLGRQTIPWHFYIVFFFNLLRRPLMKGNLIGVYPGRGSGIERGRVCLGSHCRCDRVSWFRHGSVMNFTLPHCW